MKAAGRHPCPCTQCALPCHLTADDSKVICWFCETGTHRTPVPTPWEVTLTGDDIETARSEAEASIVQNAIDGRGLHYQAPGQSNFDVHFVGYGAEIAASRMTGLARRPFELLTSAFRRHAKAPDIGHRTEVRWTWRERGHLLGYPGEPRHHLYLLLVGRMPTFRGVGWIEGHAMQISKYWREPPQVLVPGWWCPQSDERGRRVLSPLPLPDDA